MSDAPFPKTRKRDLLRHLVGVPVDDEMCAVCVVLWQSSYYKGVITLGISSVRSPRGVYPDTPASVRSLMDTSATIIRSGFWHLGPKIDVRIADGFSTRRVAGTIWCDDKEVRESTPEDRHTVPELGCAGMGMFEQYLSFLDNEDASAKLFVRNRKLMEVHLQRYPIKFGGT